MNQITTRTRIASLAGAVAVNAALIATAFAAFPSTEPMAVATMPVVEITAQGTDVSFPPPIGVEGRLQREPSDFATEDAGSPLSRG